MRQKLLFHLSAFALILVGCEAPATPSSDPTATPDTACENLRSIDCPEGFGSPGGVSCVEVLTRSSARRPLPIGCWAHARSVAEAKGCGSLRCVR